jgi:hypothetical protein
MEGGSLPEFKSLDEVYLLLGLLTPGLIIFFIRSRFTTGRIPPHAEAILSYLTVSIIYYALALPFIEYVLTFTEPGYRKAFAWITLVIVGPAVCGLSLGVIVQKGIGQKVLKFFGLRVVHVMPTAWDYKFGYMPAQWVLVTLKNGIRFGGFYARDSLASSNPQERDIFIEQVYDIGDDEGWTARTRDAGLLIKGDEISTINFFHD